MVEKHPQLKEMLDWIGGDPIGVAEYHLHAELPSELKGKLPTARQLLSVVRPILPAEKFG